jgi:hypothetical protein
MYVAIKKIKVSTVYFLVSHWLIVPTYRVGPIAVCSLVTRIASKLDMLQGASLEFIEEHHGTFGYDHLFHAHHLKRVNDELYMMYGEIQLRLPNLELALYYIRTFHVDLQAQLVNARAPRRTASERITRH